MNVIIEKMKATAIENYNSRPRFGDEMNRLIWIWTFIYAYTHALTYTYMYLYTCMNFNANIDVLRMRWYVCIYTNMYI
jgi:hypothetical protein